MADWERFEQAAKAAGRKRIVDLFASEPGRLERLTVEAAGLTLDLSKQPWDRAAFDAALALAKDSGVEAARDRLFAGEAVNVTEDRAVLHPALRAPDGAQFSAKGQPVSAAVEAGRAKMRAFAREIAAGDVRTILHIGIGGSDLGPRLVWEALKPLGPKIDLRFVANVDGAEFAQATAGLDPATTLVIAVSKTFTTQETMANARAAREWLGGHAGANFAAVSANVAEAVKFGVPEDRVFAFWDWVGGRYSVWSAVGLSCAIALGWEVFEQFLHGAADLDAHFTTAPLEKNAPVLLALAHILNRNGLGRPIRAVVPYAQRLRLLPAFLQQLEMESNGKRVTADGRPVPRPTAASVFGEVGANGQHAFFQLLHQGTDIIPVDFIAVARTDEGPAGMHQMLLANVIAQAEALMVGQPDAPEPHRVFEGDRPSTMILLDRLTPRTLGALIALYEHKTFVEGVIWEINSFDQFGVELGKKLATGILEELIGGPAKPHDPSTAALIARLKR
ncbi:MAG TPA: glucose-6-phosphate isomerase [Caulobacteraceae bacterium]